MITDKTWLTFFIVYSKEKRPSVVTVYSSSSSGEIGNLKISGATLARLVAAVWTWMGSRSKRVAHACAHSTLAYSDQSSPKLLQSKRKSRSHQPIFVYIHIHIPWCCLCCCCCHTYSYLFQPLLGLVCQSLDRDESLYQTMPSNARRNTLIFKRSRNKRFIQNICDVLLLVIICSV